MKKKMKEKFIEGARFSFNFLPQSKKNQKKTGKEKKGPSKGER